MPISQHTLSKNCRRVAQFRLSDRFVSLSLLFGLLSFFSACQGEEELSTERPTGEVENFGIPGKGDQNCAADTLLCWGAADAENARALMNAERAFLVGELPRKGYLERVYALQNKIGGERMRQLLKLQGEAGDRLTDEALVRALFEGVYGEVLAGYWSAHVTILSPTLASELEGESGDSKNDGVTSTTLPAMLPIPGELREAFQALWAQGPLGQYLATMVSLSGVPDFKEEVRSLGERALLEGEGLDREGAAIVERYARYAALDGLFASLQASIPIAGFFISVPYGIYAQFKHRAHLSFALARLYGLDPRQPNDFLLTIQLLSVAQGFKELLGATIQAIIGRQSYIILSERRPDLLPAEFSDRRIGELVQANLAQLGVYGLRLLASLSKGAAKGSVKALLGQITFGVAALADVTIDYFNTTAIGRELRQALHPWGWALYLEGAEALEDPSTRHCAYRGISQLIISDGITSDGELKILRDALSRPFVHRGAVTGATLLRESSRGPNWSAFMTRDEILGELDAALALSEEALGACLQSTWGERESFEQLSLLSWLRLTLYADGFFNEYESSWYDWMIEALPVSTREARVYREMVNRVDDFTYQLPEAIDALWIWGYLDDAQHSGLEDEALFSAIEARLSAL
ncbi:MAG: hypothetical protein VYD19_05620 [Myxococcota bacterium]|nr:hypothetical protein [Myxococcota bacterium]